MKVKAPPKTSLLADIPVVVLCGGKGTRMREDGELRPKPMVEVGGKPILWHIMRTYAHHGFRHFVLPLGYKGHVIRRYFQTHGAHLGWKVDCIDTGTDTLKGARIKRVEQALTQPFFHVTYGDGLIDADLTKLHRYHLSHGKLATVSAVKPPSRFGELVMKGTRVIRFIEKPQLSSGSINGGYFVFNKDFLGYLRPDADCDLEFGALQTISEKDELRAYRHDGFWQCMDTPRERDYLNRLWRQGAPWKLWKK